MLKAKNYDISLPSDDLVFSYYLGEKLVMGRMYQSPFRDDRNPSCSFFMSHNGKILFRDFGIGKTYSAIDFVKDKFKCDYITALKTISNDKEKINSLQSPEKRLEKDFTIGVVGDLLSKYLDYWKEYGIERETLDRYGVKAASSIYRNDELYAKATYQSPIFVYTFPSRRVRIYRPRSRTKKWYGNANELDIGGLVQLNSKGTILFITSSIKDVMVIRQMGFNAICPSSESTDPKFLRPILGDLRSRFKYIIILYDSDDAGRNYSSRLKREYGDFFEMFLVKSKDISDRTKKVGLKKSRKEFLKLISKLYKSDIYDRETLYF